MVTEFPFYEPGNTVTGTIYLRLHQALSGVKGIKLSVKGGRTISIDSVYFEQNSEGQLEETQKTFTEKKAFLHYDKEVINFSSSELAPGDYSVRFSFKLPAKLPSSFNWHGKTISKAKIKVKYYVKATLDCIDSHYDMKHK